MPLKIRWSSKEYFGSVLLLLGMSGIFQLLFIFIGQYFLAMGNYIIIVLIPIGIWVALFYATLIIYESYAQVERREKLRTRFLKSKIKSSTLKRFLSIPVTKPLLVIFIFFSFFFFIVFLISIAFFDNTIAFLTAEVLSAVICLLIANLIEKNYGRIKKF